MIPDAADFSSHERDAINDGAPRFILAFHDVIHQASDARVPRSRHRATQVAPAFKTIELALADAQPEL